MVLDQPKQFLPIVVDAIQDELVFYSIDMDGRFVFLSNSAEAVLNHAPKQWQNRTFIDALTENPCNDSIRTCEWNSLEGNSSTGKICEIYDRDGNRLLLKYWRVHIIRDGVPIGLSGIIRRLDVNANGIQELDSVAERELMKRVESLTPVEFQVIDMVVDGNMNKKMAATLGVAVRTIESRRARAIAKLQSKTLSELIQTWVHVRRIKARQS
ncbi:MAG: LuxR C-terminal-related transcriptional regulator [Planctomycetota bacterium]|nr:LuxR C-terminal-related transcriptional regulator [Planctomycetota bacterium]